MLVVRTYPDPVLSRRTTPVKRIDRDVLQLVTEMFDTMYREHGVGLAAPQVGESIRLCVVNCTGKSEDERVLVNPVILDASGEAIDEEGCLSVPGIRSKVTRSARIRVSAYDQSGRELNIEADGLEARVLQHELDHLRGQLFFQTLNDAARIALMPRLKALEDKFRKQEATE